MQTERGFDIKGQFHMSPNEPPGLENGQIITLVFEDGQRLLVTVTKAFVLDGVKYITYNTPLVSSIEPEVEDVVR